jgi:hypothetical protein
MKRKFVVTYLNLVVFHNIINIHNIRSVEINIRQQTSVAVTPLLHIKSFTWKHDLLYM